MDQPLMCLIHKQPALFYDHQLQTGGKQFVCKECIQQRLKIDPIEEFLESKNKTLKTIVTKSDQSLKLLKELLECLEAYKENLIQAIDNLLGSLNQKYKYIQDKQSNIKQLFKQYQNTTDYTIIQEEKKIMDIINQLNDQTQIQLNTLVQASKTDNMFEILNNNSQKIGSFNECSIESSLIIDKKFDYQLMQQSIYKQNEEYYAIAFNQDSSILFAACDKLIKVFEFQNDKLNELQQLKPNLSVRLLAFMKKQNQLVSIHQDQILIWKQNQFKQWQFIQVIKDTAQSYCIKINKNENMLIIGSDKIKFWSYQYNTRSWNFNQSIDYIGNVISISLNEKEDKLIAICGQEILVIQLQDKQWMIKQCILVEYYCNKSCFINQKQFVAVCDKNLQIFDCNAKDQFYIKEQEFQFSSYIGLNNIQYISHIGLLLIGDRYSVYLIKRNQNGQFTVEQSIKYHPNYIRSIITDNGKYIFTFVYNYQQK